jgi:hypothetical protein
MLCRRFTGDRQPILGNLVGDQPPDHLAITCWGEYDFLILQRFEGSLSPVAAEHNRLQSRGFDVRTDLLVGDGRPQFDVATLRARPLVAYVEFGIASFLLLNDAKSFIELVQEFAINIASASRNGITVASWRCLGVNDFVMLLFSDSYDDLYNIVSLLRATKIEHLRSHLAHRGMKPDFGIGNANHVFRSSYTVLGFHWPSLDGNTDVLSSRQSETCVLTYGTYFVGHELLQSPVPGAFLPAEEQWTTRVPGSFDLGQLRQTPGGRLPERQIVRDSFDRLKRLYEAEASPESQTLPPSIAFTHTTWHFAFREPRDLLRELLPDVALSLDVDAFHAVHYHLTDPSKAQVRVPSDVLEFIEQFPGTSVSTFRNILHTYNKSLHSQFLMFSFLELRTLLDSVAGAIVPAICRIHDSSERQLRLEELEHLCHVLTHSIVNKFTCSLHSGRMELGIHFAAAVHKVALAYSGFMKETLEDLSPLIINKIHPICLIGDAPAVTSYTFFGSFEPSDSQPAPTCLVIVLPNHRMFQFMDSLQVLHELVDAVRIRVIDENQYESNTSIIFGFLSCFVPEFVSKCLLPAMHSRVARPSRQIDVRELNHRTIRYFWRLLRETHPQDFTNPEELGWQTRRLSLQTTTLVGLKADLLKHMTGLSPDQIRMVEGIDISNGKGDSLRSKMYAIALDATQLFRECRADLLASCMVDAALYVDYMRKYQKKFLPGQDKVARRLFRTRYDLMQGVGHNQEMREWYVSARDALIPELKGSRVTQRYAKYQVADLDAVSVQDMLELFSDEVHRHSGVVMKSEDALGRGMV